MSLKWSEVTEMGSLKRPHNSLCESMLKITRPCRSIRYNFELLESKATKSPLRVEEQSTNERKAI